MQILAKNRYSCGFMGIPHQHKMPCPVVRFAIVHVVQKSQLEDTLLKNISLIMPFNSAP